MVADVKNSILHVWFGQIRVNKYSVTSSIDTTTLILLSLSIAYTNGQLSSDPNV